MHSRQGEALTVTTECNHKNHQRTIGERIMTARKRLLLVDDEPLVVELYRFILESAAFEIRCASSYAEAVAALEQEFFDALLCDIRMEPLDGFAIATYARRQQHALPIAFITGMPTQGDRQRAARFEARILYKPVPAALLIAEVQNLCAQSLADDSWLLSPAAQLQQPLRKFA